MRPPRVQGFSYLGLHRYLITICTKDRRERFVNAPVVDSAHAQFQRTADDEQFDILAYCFMPDHVHLVLEGTSDDSNLPTFVSISKQRAAYALWTDHKLSKVWQRGYHDRVIRPGQSILDAIRYVLNNPVRAGLVQKWDDYPFSGCKYPLE